jgi:HD-GYP domain-containing protein (c-di-GMP phosphodiesterase class II)
VSQRPHPRFRSPRPGGIALVFLLASVPYILFSDRLLLGLVDDAAALTTWQTVKGWGYVLVAAGLVFLLERRIARRHQRALAQQRAAYDAAIEGWARALDLREHETGGHARRVTELARRLGQRLGLQPDELENLRHGALLHDVGKIGVRDAVLSKPGPLDADEWAEMQKHTVLGHELLVGLPGLREATSVVRSHHERWDGAGYPDGLTSASIPRLARIFAVVDVYDALRSDRPYRRAWAEDEVHAYLRAERGRHFDPEAVDAFLDMLVEGDASIEAQRPAPV